MNNPVLPVEGDTFFLDNSRFEHILRCDRRAEYAIARKRTQGTNPALFLGEVLHLCLKFRYGWYPTHLPLPPEVTFKQFQIIDKMYENYHIPVDEYRTADFAKAVIRAYNQTYPVEEQFDLLQQADGPVVEQSFAVPLGTIDNIKVVWKGRLDLLVALRSNGGIYVPDHKTSSIAGDYFAQDFYRSSQMQGYTYAARTLGYPAKGVLLNVLVTRKPTKSGKGTEFQRFKIDFSDEVINAWQFNTLTLISDFVHDFKRNYFPERSTQCITKYGRCPFYDICLLDPESRLMHLYGPGYTEDHWDPLHPDAVDLHIIYNQPVPADYEQVVGKATPVAHQADVSSLINDILGQLPNK